jgi:hypothetical protein
MEADFNLIRNYANASVFLITWHMTDPSNNHSVFLAFLNTLLTSTNTLLLLVNSDPSLFATHTLLLHDNDMIRVCYKYGISLRYLIFSMFNNNMLLIRYFWMLLNIKYESYICNRIYVATTPVICAPRCCCLPYLNSLFYISTSLESLILMNPRLHPVMS